MAISKKKKWFVDKPGSVALGSEETSADGHLSRATIARSLERSTRMSIASRMSWRTSELAACATRFANHCTLFDLASSGVYPADRVTSIAGELLPHLFTLTTR